MESLPDFVKLAEAYGAVGIRAKGLRASMMRIREMIEVDRPVIFDCRVASLANCFPNDPVGQGASRDAARRGCARRRHRGGDRRRKQVLV